MEKLKIKVHPTFIFFACLLIYFGQGFLFLNYLVTIFLHEFAHAHVAKKLNYKIKNIKILPFGICLNMQSTTLSPKDEIKIALAGPLANLVICIICFALWWIFPFTYNFTYLFCYANFITFAFNLLPAFPLDGGRVLLAVLKDKKEGTFAVKFCKIINILLSLSLFLIFIWSCFFTPNFTYLFVIFCILSGVFEVNERLKYSPISFFEVKKIGKVVKIKNLYVKENEKIFKLCRHIDKFSFLNLHIYDENNNLISVLNETEYVQLLEKAPSTFTFKNALKTINGTF